MDDRIYVRLSRAVNVGETYRPRWAGPGVVAVDRAVAQARGWQEVPAPASDARGLWEHRDGVWTRMALTGDQGAALQAAGYGDLAALRDASDDDLLAVPHIGEATVRKIRAALAEE